jgi:hypothetical protein
VGTAGVTLSRDADPSDAAPASQPRDVRVWLRAEGLAAGIAGLLIYSWLGGQWLPLVVLLFLPYISMVGYLRDPRLGAQLYNLAHNWAVALLVLGLGFLTGQTSLSIAGAILVAHVGVDRLAGYGLKYPTSFADTHLGRIGRRR